MPMARGSMPQRSPVSRSWYCSHLGRVQMRGKKGFEIGNVEHNHREMPTKTNMVCEEYSVESS